MFCSNKDKIPDSLKSNCVYHFTCPGCASDYVGKTDRNFITRITEHGTYRKDQTSAVYNHLSSCPSFKELLSIFMLPCDRDASMLSINIPQHILETVKNNTKIIALNDSWVQLCFLEALLIKRLLPSLNQGIKNAKDLVLFL